MPTTKRTKRVLITAGSAVSKRTNSTSTKNRKSRAKSVKKEEPVKISAMGNNLVVRTVSCPSSLPYIIGVKNASNSEEIITLFTLLDKDWKGNPVNGKMIHIYSALPNISYEQLVKQIEVLPIRLEAIITHVREGKDYNAFNPIEVIHVDANSHMVSAPIIPMKKIEQYAQNQAVINIDPENGILSLIDVKTTWKFKMTPNSEMWIYLYPSTTKDTNK